MVNKIRQPEGCIGISEKCVFTGKFCRVATGSNLSGFFFFFLAIVVLQVLFLNLIS